MFVALIGVALGCLLGSCVVSWRWRQDDDEKQDLLAKVLLDAAVQKAQNKRFESELASLRLRKRRSRE